MKQSELQERLVQKLGMNTARPFALNFPEHPPNSVIIRGDNGEGDSMGVSYEVRVHIGESVEDHKGQKKSTVAMTIRKVLFLRLVINVSLPAEELAKQPLILLFFPGSMGR